MNKQTFKPFGWGLGVGAVVVLIVIFATGWVVTSGSAKEMAQEKAEQAVIDRLSKICVAHYKEDPEKEAKLEKLKDESSWQRGDFVEAQGWATMPGAESPNAQVANECAERIMNFE